MISSVSSPSRGGGLTAIPIKMSELVNGNVVESGQIERVVGADSSVVLRRT